MFVGKAIYSILNDDAGVEAFIEDRIYPNVAMQGSAFPFVVYQVTGDSPTDTKDGVSVLDENIVSILCYSQSYIISDRLADAVRTALDRVDGTYEAVIVQGIQYLSYDEDFDVKGDDSGVYVKSLNFRIRVINN